MSAMERLRAGLESFRLFPVLAIRRHRISYMVPLFGEITRLPEMLVSCPLAGHLR